jgi:hypothetical protein
MRSKYLSQNLAIDNPQATPSAEQWMTRYAQPREDTLVYDPALKPKQPPTPKGEDGR